MSDRCFLIDIPLASISLNRYHLIPLYLHEHGCQCAAGGLNASYGVLGDDPSRKYNFRLVYQPETVPPAPSTATTIGVL